MMVVEDLFVISKTNLVGDKNSSFFETSQKLPKIYRLWGEKWDMILSMK